MDDRTTAPSEQLITHWTYDTMALFALSSLTALLQLFSKRLAYAAILSADMGAPADPDGLARAATISRISLWAAAAVLAAALLRWRITTARAATVMCGLTIGMALLGR